MYLLCFLYRFMTLPPATRAEQPAADERIEKVVRYIADNIAEPLTLDGLALLSGYSLSHFKLRFREVTGVTPAMYITLARVERAREELEKGDRSIPYIYQVLKRELPDYCSKRYVYFNWEEDVGSPGLREMKLRYHPDILMVKYRAEEVSNEQWKT